MRKYHLKIPSSRIFHRLDYPETKISMKLVAAQFFLGSALAQFSEIPWKVDNFENLDNWYVDVVPNSNNNEYQVCT